MNEPLLLATDVAKLLQVPAEHVYRLARQGEITSIRFGRYVRFTKSAVESFISSKSAVTK